MPLPLITSRRTLVVAGLLVALAGCGGDDASSGSSSSAGAQSAGSDAGSAGDPGGGMTPGDTPAEQVESLVRSSFEDGLDAWAARYSGDSGPDPKFTWTATKRSDDAWRATVRITRGSGATVRATWAIPFSLDRAPTKAEIASERPIRPVDAEARRLSELPPAEPARSGPVSIVATVLNVGQADAVSAQPYAASDGALGDFVVDDGKLDNAVLRGLELVGASAPTQPLELKWASRTTFVDGTAGGDRPSTQAEFMRQLNADGSRIVVLTWKSRAKRPNSLRDLFKRSPDEVRAPASPQPDGGSPNS